MFAYCNNNPIIAADPHGHSATLLVAIGLGALSSGLVTFATGGTKEEVINSMLWGGFMGGLAVAVPWTVPYLIGADALINTISAWGNGATTGAGLLVGAITVGAALIPGINTGDPLADMMVDVVLGTGSDLCLAGTYELLENTDEPYQFPDTVVTYSYQQSGGQIGQVVSKTFMAY